MFSHQRKRLKVAFALADAALTLFSFEAAYWTRVHLPFSNRFFLSSRENAVLALFCAAVWVTLGSRRGVYEYLDSADLGSPAMRRLFGQTLRQCLLGTTLLVILQYVLNPRYELSRTFLGIFLGYNFTILAAFRSAAPALVAAFERSFGKAYHVVLVGTPARLDALERRLRHPALRVVIAAKLSAREAHARIPPLLAGRIVDEVIFDVDSRDLADLEPVFANCDEEGVRTRVALEFFPHVNSRVTVDRIGDTALLTFSAAPNEDLALALKRTIDLAVSACALVALSPVFLALAFLIKATSEGGVIYRQTRCGWNGRTFTLYKFRSMVPNAESLRPGLEHLSERQIAFKLANDPRVTSAGRWLRKYSLDELPQLWNVFLGDMSLVGPRPPLPGEVACYQRWQKRRLRMRPGMTCLWALKGRDRLDFDSWMRADLSYIDNWSLALDWSILLRTIPLVLSGRGAH